MLDAHCHTAPFEHRDTPVPGLYRHYAGRGWYLVDVYSERTVDGPSNPGDALGSKVVYSSALSRWIFEGEFNSRRRRALVPTSRAAPDDNKHVQGWTGRSKIVTGTQAGKAYAEVGFFLLDDGVTWIQCYDEEGKFAEGPWRQFYLIEDYPEKTHFEEFRNETNHD